MPRYRVKSKGRSSRKFSRSSRRTHRKNVRTGPMRGGIRL